MNVPKMITINEAKEMTGLSYDALRKMCIHNKIVHIRVGTKYYINTEKLVEYLNAEGVE